MFCRQRSTLRRLYFGPKDGEHLTKSECPSWAWATFSGVP
jgi:hypothetical protein